MAAVAAAAAARGRAGWPAARRFSTEAAHTLLREHDLGREPQVVPFEIDEAEARRRFLAWQSGAARLAPAGLLPEGGAWSLRPALLPFWLFDVAARMEYAGSVGLADGKGGPLVWRQVGWKELPDERYSWRDRDALQVYGSYKYRRDYAAVAHGPRALRRLQPLPRRDAERGAFASQLRGGDWLEAGLDPPAMRQAIAWELARRDIREAEHRVAEQRLLAAHGGAATRDVRVALHVRERAARLAFLPAFHLRYDHGEAFNAHGERVPAHFEALIGGTVEGGVAGTRHLSPRRAGGCFAAAALGATAAAAPLLGTDPWGLVNVETGFALLTASSLAGLGARMWPLWARQAGEASRLRASDEEFERVAAMGLGPLDTGSEEQELLRSAAEWRRWEAAGEEGGWREHKRAAWAEELFSAQHRRRLERKRLRERLDAERARQEEEERREERRHARWGRSSHHAFHRSGGGGGAAGAAFAGGLRGGGRRDYLGYYAALGLEAAAARGPVGEEEIKRAFRRAALRWHPDKQASGDEAARRAARDRFHAVRAAYDVLRCPDRRRAYDRGEPLDAM